MPPTLGKSQVSTVRKQMKLQIIAICKNPCCLDYHGQIVSILTELGTSNNEVSILTKKIQKVVNKLGNY